MLFQLTFACLGRWANCNVRCAQVLERERASQMGTPSPIHDTIEDTHLNYNRCVRPTITLVSSMPCAKVARRHFLIAVPAADEWQAALAAVLGRQSLLHCSVNNCKCVCLRSCFHPFPVLIEY